MADNYTLDEGTILTIYNAYKQESKMARTDRINQNKINYDTYHLRQDFSYKQKGQSREFLPKMAMAVEQNSNFIQQGLIDFGAWFKVMPEPGLLEDAMQIKPSEVQFMLENQLKKNDFITFIANSLKSGLIGSLMICKVHGKLVSKPKYEAKESIKNGKFVRQLIKKEDKVWQLKLDLVRQEDYFPDPSGDGLYEMQDIYMDYYEVERMAQGKDAIYDLEKVKVLKGSQSAQGIDKTYSKARETGQNTTSSGYRNKIKITECWGNIISPEGELLQENVMWTIANDQYLIQKPTPNPWWHGESPYVVTPILTVPNGVWGKALMDAPAMLNRVINEMINLIIDGGLMSVHGIKQIHEHWLEDANQVSEGISPGDTLRANTSCPPGESVLKRVDTSTVPTDGLNVLNLINQEFNVAALTNDLRMGVAPFRAVKATEVVEASQSISSMFTGMAKQLEEKYATPILEKAWKTIAQNTQELNPDDLKSLVGAARANELQNMSNEELFAETVGGCKFQVFGISAILNKQKDFTKLQALLQTIFSAPMLMEEFNKKYSFTKLLEEIMESLDINKYKIEADQQEGGDLTQQPGAPVVGADQQSQIPQAGAEVNTESNSPIPATEFPGSRANPIGGLV